MCPDANFGDTGTLVINGETKTFTKRTRTQLDALINANQADPEIALTCTSGITDMSELFKYVVGGFSQNIESWDVSNVTDMSEMFFSIYQCSFNQSLNNWDVSNVVNMINMFRNCYSFNQPLNNWDVSNVTNMQGMFSSTFVGDATSSQMIFNQPLNSWDVSNVTNMNEMFRNSVSFNQDLSDWDVSSVTNMNNMFNRALAFNQNLNDWSVSNVTDMSFMFSSASSFNQDLNSWNVSNVTNMSRMFNNAILFNRPLNNWNMLNVTDMSGMFNNVSEFNQDLSIWDFNSIEFLTDFLSNSNMSVLNYDALLQSFLSQNITNVRLGAQLIGYCDEITRNQLIQNKDWIIDGDLKAECGGPTFFANSPFITTWEVTSDDLEISIYTTENIYNYNYTIDWGDGTIESGLTGNSSHTYQTSGTYTVSITGVFPHFMLCSSSNNFNCDNAKKIKSVESWGNQLWKSMFSTFRHTEDLVFNATSTPILAQVTSMESMFQDAKGFNSPIEDWDVSNVENLRALFFFTDDFNQPLNNWDVSNVNNFQGVFSSANSFNQSLVDWDVSNAKTMTAMFAGPTSFNQPLNNWDVSGVVSMQSMFFNNQAFNHPLDNWDVSKVTIMQWLFYSATSFNQNINIWDVSKVKNMSSMFRNASSFNQPLNNWDTSNVTITGGMFWDAPAFNQPLNNWDTSNVTRMNLMFSGASSFNQDLSNWNFNNEILLTNMLSNSGLDKDNYDLLLESFNTQNLQNKTLGAEGLEYCDETSRNDLINNKGWTINGDSLSDNCITCEVPFNLSVSQINTTSAQISFDSSQNGSANVLVMNLGEVPGIDTPIQDYQINGFQVGNNSFIQLNLEPNTAYDIYIRFNCSITDFSEYAGPLSFQTLCETTELPNGDVQQSFCEEPTVDDVSVTGQNLAFYEDASLSNTIQSSSILNDNQLIYVTQTIDGCESDALAIAIIVGDDEAPIPNIEDLSELTGECEVTSLTAPTATDNCDGEITATTDAVLPITETETIIWTYQDESGNTTTQNQLISINDTTSPVPDVQDLDDVVSACEVASLTAPTATDNCDGEIVGTTDVSFPITESMTIDWIYEDTSGNMATQSQNIVIDNSQLAVTLNDNQITLVMDENGFANIQNHTLDYNTNAACGDLSFTYDNEIFDCEDFNSTETNQVLITFSLNGETIDAFTVDVILSDPDAHCQNISTDSFNKQNISIYPNPANNTIHIVNTLNSTVDGFDIYDLKGRKISTIKNSSNIKTIDVSNYEEGMYILKLHGGSKSVVHKFIIKR
ncbi:hypothetical protein GCM10010832_26200 [Psychroflexus planctonicus]|uniref:Por secretion system C-terminal sorting domain-containing protein n=2 Tax=Psychroflexus planctonicus TaxID=1526575 RepID=A0ABQ1SLC7_9FLAO|nr:hypothetical protein GCM10010832_26200 [Psychroflexus planctonicus]